MSGTTPEPPLTGLEPVDRVLAREAEIAALPVTQRAAAYEELHAELERILEERPGALPAGLIRAVSGPGSGDPAGREDPMDGGTGDADPSGAAPALPGSGRGNTGAGGAGHPGTRPAGPER